MGEQPDLAEAASTAGAVLLRSIALTLAEAAATGTPLPAPLAASLERWLQGGWQAGEAQDRDFAPGYLAGLALPRGNARPRRSSASPKAVGAGTRSAAAASASRRPSSGPWRPACA